MLKIKSVHKYFRGIHALKDVSIELDGGTVLALVGDNGAGKSTLMKCISGVINPDAGSIIFNGQDITWGDPSSCRSAGIEMIYQDLALCRLQDVVSNVFLGCEETKGFFLNKGSMARKCRITFAGLGIDIPLNSIVGSLSGGQQQSIAIARSMLSNPKLLIMDEPTAALAVKEAQRVIEHILRLKQRQVSVVMITHRLGDVFDVADRIMVMRQGEVKYDLAPHETDLKDLTSKIVGG
jgi:ABC-type sugar transport system ATPase subunit